jgi:protein-S-isoprenylcysteine O-methyltransferase Ste14
MAPFLCVIRKEVTMNRHKILPPTCLLIALFAMIILALFLPVTRFIPQPWNLTGIVPLIAGMAMNLAADRAFKQAGTTVKPYQESSVLITDGVYQFSRNPMYLGFVLILLGLALLLAALSPFIVIILYAVAMDQIFIRVEERMLAEKFGDQWDNYRVNVRKWL